MGTLEWQTLLPVAASRQFAVKVGVAVSLAIVLGLGLPTVLVHFSRTIRSAGPEWSLRPDLVALAIITLLTSGSLYVSSLCRSALWALLMSVPGTLGASMFLGVSMDWLRISWYLAATRMPNLLMLLLTGFIAILLWFAFTNHRSADRPAAGVWRQVILMAAYVTAAVVTTAAAQAVNR